MAHDLGHPPFGHVGETTLNELMTEHGASAGFEGNAQSFRIVTRLAVRREDKVGQGLNLTRATLNAILKYPWVREADGKRKHKWGAYHTERDELSFARAEIQGLADGEQCAAAFLMDLADDITYSVHDVEDFFRAGMLPLDRWVVDSDEREAFVCAMFEEPERADTRQVIEDLVGIVFSTLNRPFAATRKQRGALRGLVSTLVERFILAIDFSQAAPGVAVDGARKREIAVLKRLMHYYIFANPALAGQQYGQRKVIEDVFGVLHSLVLDHDSSRMPKSWSVLPISIRDSCTAHMKSEDAARLVADAIASMTEHQLFALHARLRGTSVGSVSNKIVL